MTNTDRPWLDTLARNPEYLKELTPTTVPELLAQAVAHAGDSPAVMYYGWQASWRELDEMAEAFAAYLFDRGFGAGDVLAVYLQNVPHYYIAVFAVWKLGGIIVPVNPMYKDELDHVFSDSGAKALVVGAAAYNDRVKDYVSAIDIVLTCDDRGLVQREADRVFGAFPAQGTTDRPELLAVVAENRGRTVEQAAVTPASTAIYGYTSGTSGRAKGAVLSHGNLTVNAVMTRDMQDLGRDNRIFTLAPVFHITGFVCQFLANVACQSALVMNYRFEPATTLEIFRADKPSYMAGPATAFMALLATPGFAREDFDSFSLIMSGGAPLPEAIVDKFESITGHYIGQGYGLTETSAQCALVPQGFRAPVDKESGNLSCGLPVASTLVRILDDDGAALGPREIGEVCVSGPMVAASYLHNPEATAAGIPGGELHTGDVGYLDEEGWLYIVDRKKDMINASGFKVWPREVEDALYLLPQVLEAAVVGVPDEYRGENVVAYVTKKPGTELTAEQVIAHAREHLAGFKAPRRVEIIDEMPKTASGKVLRRELRETAKAAAAETAAKETEADAE